MFPNMQLKRTLFLFGLFLWSSESLRCNIGFSQRNNSCVDTNECLMVPGVCGNHSQCFNTNGGYYCTCNAGFRSTTPNFTATTGECRDLNECFEKTHECPGSKVCKNTIGSYECSCPLGYHETRTDSECEVNLINVALDLQEETVSVLMRMSVRRRVRVEITLSV
ncbi:adhesion G protein-coupled receptor E1-like [Labeo rohita]|uniref:adhesion G protein-coupled receptor E1-like n=1 Tax=Labeo rohita TaxID=84645 RepID=UPI0021E277EB|nr:adhesion G protein-coupled receptor E1-like [Labeo rohita]